MKSGTQIKLALLAVAFLALLSFKADEYAGVKFELKSWTNAIKASRAEKKPLFVFIGHDKCEVSIKMEKEVFTKAAVGEFFNSNFVCMQLDPNKVLNNIRATNWGAYQVPTYVFFNKKRKIVGLFSGYKDEKEMLKLGEAMLNKINGRPMEEEPAPHHKVKSVYSVSLPEE